MAFKVLTEKIEAGRRVLISGPPNTLKTTSLLTWPEPNIIVSLPGEKGWETIPVGREGVIPVIWEFGDSPNQSAASVVSMVEHTILGQIIPGKMGEFKTLSLDGIHKLYGWYYHKCLDELLESAGKRKNWDGDEEKLRGAAYGRAHDEFGLFISRVSQNKSISYLAATVWEGKTKDDTDDQSKNATKHIFPDLPGEMARRIVGEFSVVCYSEVNIVPDMNKNLEGKWQIRPGGKIWGVGAKVPAEIAITLPDKVPQDFKILERLLKGEQIPGLTRGLKTLSK
jgi:hypothetical protein